MTIRRLIRGCPRRGLRRISEKGQKVLFVEPTVVTEACRSG